jgi:peptidoglycan/xylan/chitin deacetylase (PgdA/CDA1 family)
MAQINKNASSKRMSAEICPLELEQGVLLISIDVEFAWGFADILETDIARKYISIIGKRSRRNMREVLKISENLNVPMTFGFVGKLLLDDETSRTSIWHAKDIFQNVLDSKVDHEIACHSFSHIDFSKCTREEAIRDISMCKKIMRSLGIDPLSFLYPRNRLGYLDVLEKEGFKTFRFKIDYKYLGIPIIQLFNQTLSLPIKVGGLVAIPSNLLFQSSKFISSTAILFATLKALREASAKRRVLHLAFHDYLESNVLIYYLSYILKYAKKLERKGLIRIKTMRDLYEEH